MDPIGSIFYFRGIIMLEHITSTTLENATRYGFDIYTRTDADQIITSVLICELNKPLVKIIYDYDNAIIQCIDDRIDHTYFDGFKLTTNKAIRSINRVIFNRLYDTENTL